MAFVCNTTASRYRYKTDENQTGVPQNIQTVREKILQQCLNRFYSTPRQLHNYQDQRQKFVASGNSKDVPVAEAISGLVDFNAFKTHVENSEIQMVLRESGLTKHEIGVLFAEVCETTPSSNAHLPDDVAATSHLTTLNGILKKLAEREITLSTEDNDQPQNFAGAVELSRIEYEDALRQDTLCRNSDEVLSTVATSALIKRKTHRPPAVHPQHPLNHLVALERELFAGRECAYKEHEHSYKPSVHGAKRRKVIACELCVDKNEHTTCATSDSRSASSQCKNLKLGNEQNSKIGRAIISESCKSGSLWDVKDIPSNVVRDNSINTANRKVVPSYQDDAGTVKLPVEKRKDFSTWFVCLPNPLTLVPFSHITSNCIPFSKLQAEFPNYQPGTPSKILYLKNLSHQISPEELVNLFGHFDVGRDRMMYRLLQGKMRGQGFIQFPTIITAQEAFKALQGYMMRGKPLVIEFGKEKCSN